MLPFLVMVVVAGLLVGMVIGVYNTLVRLRNAWKAAFAQIDVALKRRHDLIPNLVETAKGYLAHERQTLDAVIHARSTAVDARSKAAADPSAEALAALGGAEGQLGATLGRLFALAEAYPDLKANQTMMQLSGELANTENVIASSRGQFNEAVRAYNSYREGFPAILLAGMFSFQPAAFFEITNAVEREVPRVSFS